MLDLFPAGKRNVRGVPFISKDIVCEGGGAEILAMVLQEYLA